MIGFCAVTAFIIAADLITKHLVAAGMELNSTITVIPGVFDLTYIINRGAAWGILAGKQVLLTVFTVLVLAALVFYAIKKHKVIGKLELVSIAMIVGGGIGNLIGRVFDGYVVDFINIRFVKFFNIFNVADIGITVGCILLVISVLFFGKKQNKTAAEGQDGSAVDYSEIRWDQIDGVSDAEERPAEDDAPEGGTGNGR
ncbi:MAG: signal peptidase II [Clostridia bacterium]|nr:signal peptidase II [Clostridia bacterium]